MASNRRTGATGAMTRRLRDHRPGAVQQRSAAAASLLAGLQAVALRVGAEAAEVLDDLATTQLEGAVHSDVDGVLARATVDRALAVERPDVVVAAATIDDGAPVARIDVVRAGPAAQHVTLAVVVARVPVTPEDVA